MKLQIEKVVYGGAGLAHQTEGEDAGRAVFVPFTLPGETVEAHLVAARTGHAEAELVQIIAPSNVRVEARCPHFGQCGGCQLQHAEYASQVQIRVDTLRETLERAGLTSLPEVEAHRAEPWGYRNRIRLRVVAVDGALRLGYNRPGSHEFLPIEQCPIAAPLLWRAAVALLQVAANDPAAERWFRAAVEIEFFTTGDETKLQMTLFVRKELSAGFDRLCEALQALVPELTGAGVSLLAKESAQKRRRTERPLTGAKTGAKWGADGLAYSAAGQDYWVSRGGFFQVNRFLVDEMVRIVSDGRSGCMAWDLYAGVGLFSRALARGFEQVVAVESAETAALDLSRALKGKGMRAVCASTADFLRDAVVQRERPELVVMDPPRAGVGAEVCALLARLKAAELVYVSCDPVTLSRDLRAMVDSGYTLVELHMIDMFPQTFHIEAVAVLKRESQ
jgi:23S rRNA (uracil1939-C5)-methyltransferase